MYQEFSGGGLEVKQGKYYDINDGDNGAIIFTKDGTEESYLAYLIKTSIKPLVRKIIYES
jgi:hypothetical protein